MKKIDNPLDNIRIASPCAANWDKMVGDARKRFCGDCQLNVYNLSEMTRTQAENFLLESEGRVCVRFYRRADGTILTQDCPVGWRAIKKRVSRTAAAVVSMCIGIFSGLFAFNQSNSQNDERRAGQVERVSGSEFCNVSKPENTNTLQGVMGNISVPAQESWSNGGPAASNLNEVRTAIRKNRKL